MKTNSAVTATTRGMVMMIAAIAALLFAALTTLQPAPAQAGSAGAAAVLAAPAAAKTNTYKAVSYNLAPGRSVTQGWNNNPAGASYFVDVRPIATTVTTSCQMEITRQWRIQTWNADNTRNLQMWWTVKNVGSVRCSADVYITYVRN